MSGIISDENSEGNYSALQVLHSGAGFYIGRVFTHNESSDTPGLVEPGSRESDYFPSREAAQKALETDFEYRDVPENEHLKRGTN